MEPAKQTGDRPLQSWPLAGDELSSHSGKALLTQVKTSCFPNKSGWWSFPDLDWFLSPAFFHLCFGGRDL